MRLLLTGFEPFGGAKINPSAEIARSLHGVSINDVQIVAAVLPVQQESGPAALLAALQRFQPAAVLCLGQASGRTSISIERVAVNWLDYQIPDNLGTLINDQPVVADGPAAYFTTLPVRAMQRTLQEAGIPTELSMSAGTYLCNQIFYLLLHTLAQQGRAIPAGFIHIPALPQQAAERNGMPSMALETAQSGIRLAVEVISAHLLMEA